MQGGRPRRAGWEEAPGLIRAAAERRLGADAAGSVVVGITGPVGSGKSTLAGRVGGIRLATDDYLPDYGTLPEHERDEPRHAALGLLAAHLEALRRGEAAEVPRWSFQTHARVGSEVVVPGGLIVCEGLFALRAEVRRWVDIAVFVEAPRELRLARWERLERAGARGWGVERARAYFERVAEPTFERYAAEYRASAEIIVSNDEGTGLARRRLDGRQHA